MELLGSHLVPGVSDSKALEVNVGVGGPPGGGKPSYCLYCSSALWVSCKDIKKKQKDEFFWICQIRLRWITWI